MAAPTSRREMIKQILSGTIFKPTEHRKGNAALFGEDDLP